MWTNTAFGMYMGQYDAVTASEFEPARRREVLLGNLADTQCAESLDTNDQTVSRFGLVSFALTALTAGRRLVRG